MEYELRVNSARNLRGGDLWLPFTGKLRAASAGTRRPEITKVDGGKYTYTDVVNALRKVKDKTNKDDAMAILKEDGGGAATVGGVQACR